MIYVPGLQLRWTTALTALVMLALVAWRRRSLPLALAVVIGWASLYETVWALLRGALDGGGGLPWQEYPWMAVVGVGWTAALVLARAGPAPVPLLVAAAGFAIWALTGFHYNEYGQHGPFLVGAELLNVWTKTAMGAAYLLGALGVGRWRGP